MPDLSKIISNKLRKLRIAHGLTQKQLADYLGVNRSTYTYYETGKTIPSVAVLLKLAAKYRVTLDDMAGPAIEPDPSQDENEPDT